MFGGNASKPRREECSNHGEQVPGVVVAKSVSFGTFREGPENQAIVCLKTPSENDAPKSGYLSVYRGTGLQ